MLVGDGLDRLMLVLIGIFVLFVRLDLNLLLNVAHFIHASIKQR